MQNVFAKQCTSKSILFSSIFRFQINNNQKFNGFIDLCPFERNSLKMAYFYNLQYTYFDT